MTTTTTPGTAPPSKASSKKNVFIGIPEDKINDAEKRFEKVQLRIQRTSQGNKFATIRGHFVMPPKQLYMIEEYLGDLAGGGNYFVDVRNPDNYRERIMAFRIEIEGPPHPPRIAGSPSGATAVTTGSVDNPRHPGGIQPMGYPAWVESLPADEKEEYMRRLGYQQPGYGTGPAPGATKSSDEVLSNQLSDTKASLAKLSAQFEALATKHQEETARLRDDLSAERSKALETTHAAEMSAMRSEMSALRDALAKPQVLPLEHKPSPFTNPAFLTALVPLGVALVEGRASSGSEALKTQADLQKTLMDATMKQANKADSTETFLMKALPLALPFIKTMMENKSPEKQALLYEAMANNQLNTIALMTDMVSANLPEEKPAWAEAIQTVLQGAVEASQAYLQSNGGLPGQQASQRVLPAQKPVQIIQPVSSDYTAAFEDGVERHLPQPISYMLKMVPEPFKSDADWQEILQALHYEPPLPAQSVADILVGKLEDCLDEKGESELPEWFGTADEFQAQPGENLVAVLQRLPVSGSQPEWSVKVVELTLLMLHEDKHIVLPDMPEPEPVSETVPDEVDAVGEEVEVTQTPAPAPEAAVAS